MSEALSAKPSAVDIQSGPRKSGFDMAVVAQPFRAAKNSGLKPCATQVENVLVKLDHPWITRITPIEQGCQERRPALRRTAPTQAIRNNGLVAFNDPKTYEIIGAAIAVQRELGCGFLEAVNRVAFNTEFQERGIRCRRSAFAGAL